MRSRKTQERIINAIRGKDEKVEPIAGAFVLLLRTLMVGRGIRFLNHKQGEGDWKID